MPSLKSLICHVEWSYTGTPLPEYMTTYNDGHVSTYIAVPPTSTPFTIHLRSDGFIAAGLAMFVYIDGIYQCNRNRLNLRAPSQDIPRSATEVSFRVRQKEESKGESHFEGKAWRFEKAMIGKLVYHHGTE